MRDAVFRFILGAFALALVIDIAILVLYRVYAHFCRNRLLDKYADGSSNDSPPIFVRLTGFTISVIVNLIIYIVF